MALKKRTNGATYPSEGQRPGKGNALEMRQTQAWKKGLLQQMFV